MPKPKLLAEIHRLSAEKNLGARAISRGCGVAQSTVSRVLARDESPFLTNCESIRDWLLKAPPKERIKKKGKAKGKGAREK